MKIKKIISLIIVLCMMMSTLSIGVVFSSAAEVEGADDKVAAEVDNFSAVSGTDSTWWYTPATGATHNVTNEEWSEYKALIEDHYIDSADYFFFPDTIFATQSVTGGGKLYALLCSSGLSPQKRDYEELGMAEGSVEKFIHFLGTYWLMIFTIYEDASGNKKVVNETQINPGKLKTVDMNTKSVNDPWTITEKKGDSLSEAHNVALEEYKDIKLTYIAQIGNELSGINATGNYHILCYGTINSKTNLYVVDLYEDEGEKDNKDDNKAEIINISLFDLNKYAGFKDGEEPYSNNNDDSNPETTRLDNNSNINSSATNDSTGKSYDNSNNANGFIATGESNITITIALVLIVMVFAVIVFSRKRKND